MSLDLYAKIEPLIGFYSEYDKLYDKYISLFKKYKPKTLLDVGCGRGAFLEKIKSLNIESKGIDLSKEMIKVAKLKSLNVSTQNLSQIDESFNLITAIGDVLNYLTQQELVEFFGDIEKSLEKNSIFMCDINTKYGFEYVTDGVMVKDLNSKFLSIEANFENNILDTTITLFEKKFDNLYSKEQSNIKQYYHKIEEIKKSTNLKLIKIADVKLFSNDFADKKILIFKKEI